MTAETEQLKSEMEGIEISDIEGQISNLNLKIDVLDKKINEVKLILSIIYFDKLKS